MFFYKIAYRLWISIWLKISNKSMIVIFPPSFLRFILIGFFPSSYAELSTTTTNVIQGTSPYLMMPDGTTKLTDLNQLMVIEMPKQDNVEQTDIIDTSMASTTLKAPPNMTFNQITLMTLADGELHDLEQMKVASDDGDAIEILNTSVGGQIKATWFNGSSQKITKLDHKLTSCGGPYTLTIEIPTAVSANTAYGFPNKTHYGTHNGVSYTFISDNQGICYLKPKNMNIYAGIEGKTIKYSQGFNADKWEKNKGFKISTGFPTTGFNGASFSLIGAGDDQRKYRCSSPDNGSKIKLSGTSSIYLGANCTITYNVNSKAEFINGGSPIIDMEYDIGGGDWQKLDSYQIPIPTKWAIVRGKLIYADKADMLSANKFPTLDECRLVVDGNNAPLTTSLQATDLSEEGKAWRQKYLYRRNELSNSPYSDPLVYPQGSKPAYVDSFYSRDVDGTFTGEWGYLNDYSNAGWGTLIWSADVYSVDNYPYQYDVHSYGSVHYVAAISAGYATVCRGD